MITYLSKDGTADKNGGRVLATTLNIFAHYTDQQTLKIIQFSLHYYLLFFLALLLSGFWTAHSA